MGAGKGAISERIAPRVKKLYCIELDVRLKPYLNNLVRKYKNIKIIYGDVLKTYLPSCNKIITSLPFSIIEPFMNKMLKCKFDELVMITGNKFANNVTHNKINFLSLLVNCFFNCEKIIDILPNNFCPPPRVLCTMVKLTPKCKVTNKLQSLFKTMFLLRDKKIKNCLIEALIFAKFCSTKNEARSIISSFNLSNKLLETRFEVCSNNQLLELYDSVKTLYSVNTKYQTNDKLINSLKEKEGEKNRKTTQS